MTLLLPAADRVVREAVDAVLEGRSRPGSGADVSFATRSSRYRVIHGILKEASDASLVGARFVGWLFDGSREPTVTERWDTDARAVLIDESKGQIVVTSLTRVHVSNALPVLPETVVEPNTKSNDGFIPRAGTLHGLPMVDPEPSQEVSFVEGSAPAIPAPEAAAPEPATAESPREPAPPPPEAPVAATPSPPQATSPVPKRTIPPSPPIPGRQATPIPQGRHATPLMPIGRPATPLMPMRPPTPPRSAPAAAPRTHLGVAPPPGVLPTAPPSAPAAPPPAPPRPATHLGLAPATRFPPAPQGPIVLNEPLMTPNGPVDLSSLEEISAQLSVTGEISAAILPPGTSDPSAASAPGAAVGSAASAATDKAGNTDDDEAATPPPPEVAPGWAAKSAPLPQFDLDDADLDLPTRADPMPPAPPSEEEAVIPLIPRN